MATANLPATAARSQLSARPNVRPAAIEAKKIGGKYPPFYSEAIIGCETLRLVWWEEPLAIECGLDLGSIGSVLYAHVANGEYRAIGERA